MWESTDKSLQEAFQDLNALMNKAKEMVILAEKMRQKLLSGSNSQNSSANDEEMGYKEEMQDWLLSVGIVSPVTKESTGALYHQQLSRQQSAINTLKEVEAFLSQHPTEIVTIIIEDYVHTPKGLTNLFTNAGLDKYWFPVAKMPKKGEDWPTLAEIVQNNYRLLVFTSIASKEAEEGIAH